MNQPRITRRRFVQGCAAGALGGMVAPIAWGQAPAAGRARRPNILTISTDQWHAGAFGHLGNPWVRTPHSDRIADRSVRFDQAYCADPVCAPSRTSWLTGRMPVEHGVIGNGVAIDPGMIDSGQWFGNHGYETAHFGKWHTRGRNPARSHDIYHGMHPAGQYADTSVAQMARSYLLGRPKTKPFFAHVALMNPHDICQVSCFHTAAGDLPIDPEQLPPLPDNFSNRPDEPSTLARRVRQSFRRAQQRSWDELDWRLYIWMYYRYCEQVDLAVGMILDALDASGEAENTLLVYTSDHGEGLSHHGLYTKAFLYESAARVPFYISFPGRLDTGAANTSIPVSGIDLMPTFCAAAGVPTPTDLPGEDVLGQWREGTSRREHLVISGSFGGHMVRDDRYKLIRYDNDETVQLFDLEKDPGETRNLAGEQPSRVASLWTGAEAFHQRLKPRQP
ncbi:MAG: sulfatase-like hydrolase/transferase [Phycisphaeraceae bacterium]